MRQDSSPPDRSSSGWGQHSWLDYSTRTRAGWQPGCQGSSRRGSVRGDATRASSDESPGPRLGFVVFLAVILVLCLNLGFIVEEVHYAWQRGRLRAESEEATAQLTEMARLKLTDRTLTFPLVVQRVKPSVVKIETITERANPDDGEESPFSIPRQLRTTGQGAGVVVDDDGYILTNYHVIRGATRVAVKLADGRRFARVDTIGTDPQTDLALLKIDATDLIAATWGDSNDLKEGESVLAVGNPFGLDGSVTAGIVSAKHRRNVVQNREMTYEDFLQTDAAVNPGNSGGPLLNMYGEVIGITTAIVGESFQGVGFAIPSDIARDVLARLKQSGKVVRGWLGVGLENLTADAAQRLGVPRQGVLITRVVGTPAISAGLRTDDVVLAWNDDAVNDYMDLSLKVSRTAVGSEAKITLRRGEQDLTLNVTVGELAGR